MPDSSRIYVVDDEPMIAFTLAAILKQSGFATRAFTSPLKALEAARSEPPDLLISDVAMPELSGVDLAILFRERHPLCRVLLFSGQASTSDLLVHARRRGYEFTLLTKPMHPTLLLATISELGRAAGRGESRRAEIRA